MLTRIRIVPFGPITQGKQYQKIIKINLDSFFNKLKDVLLFKEIEIEKEENLLAFLEKNCMEKVLIFVVYLVIWRKFKI